MDRFGQDGGGRAGELPTAETVEARLGRLLAIQEQVLNNLHSLRDLAHWRDEVVRLEQRRDDGICPLGDLAELLADGDEAGRSAVRACFTAWESLLAVGIIRVRDNGELAADADPDRLAAGLMAALQGGLLLARTTRDVRRLEVALDIALGYVRAHTVTP
ncbi:TetR family transcriptional regulator C-terminal domain-containing protein [Kutzneria sp. CA-103260]|uniref:TetR family transcriptional regulator C-terminal domain-containing protein n=1 Tax=Kutzneria sp. CA-103260 TaxID=2802641 RepID=UPI001BA6F31F|nr:TetR family transcriptional regulator C-terminal domain-containing protein [Kutzneria sp. CA-103260]